MSRKLWHNCLIDVFIGQRQAGKDFRKASSKQGSILAWCQTPLFGYDLSVVLLASSLRRIKCANIEARPGPEMLQQLTSAAELLALAGELCQAGPAALLHLPPDW